MAPVGRKRRNLVRIVIGVVVAVVAVAGEMRLLQHLAQDVAGGPDHDADADRQQDRGFAAGGGEGLEHSARPVDEMD